MMDLRKEMIESPTTLSNYRGLKAAMAAELMIGFWFGTGVISAVGVVDSLNYCVGVLISSSREMSIMTFCDRDYHNELTDVPTETVLAILITCIKMYVLGLTCPTVLF